MRKTKVASADENVIDSKFFNLIAQVAHFSATYGDHPQLRQILALDRGRCRFGPGHRNVALSPEDGMVILDVLGELCRTSPISV